jgi:hypothetical protein
MSNRFLSIQIIWWGKAFPLAGAQGDSGTPPSARETARCCFSAKPNKQRVGPPRNAPRYGIFLQYSRYYIYSEACMSDQFTEYYADYLDGSYDCIDRIVLNAYFPMIQTGGGFRVWWRSLIGSDKNLDTKHFMRFAGHFSRRVQAFAKKNKIPMVFCESKTRIERTKKKCRSKGPKYLKTHRHGDHTALKMFILIAPVIRGETPELVSV